MRFINRVSQYPNNKKLHVNSIEYSNGEISKLYVTEEKNEGSVTVVGTELNAENLNKAFEEFGRNRFLCIYVREMFDLIIDEDDFSFDLNGLSAFKDVDFECTMSMLYPECSSDNLTIQISLNTTNRTGTITFHPDSSLTMPITARAYVYFYSDSAHSNLVVRVPFLYTFTPSSTNPYD